MNKVNSRNAGLDILRVLLAFLVVGIHILAPATGAVEKEVDWVVSKFFCYGLEALCYPAVNTYVILSGFFAFSHKKSLYNVVRSLGKLWLCLIFFSWFGLVLGSIYYQQIPSFSTVISRLFPVSSGEWWYMTNYFVLMLLSPMLNKLIEQYSEKSHFYALGGALIVCTVMPFFLRYKDDLGLNIGYGLIWFVVLYCTGALLYRIKDIVSNKLSSTKYLIFWACSAFAFVAVNNLLGKFNATRGMGFAAYNSVLVYFEAILLFCAFYTMRVKSLRVSNLFGVLGGVSLASYVFHCQADIGPILWQITEPAKYANTLALVPVTFAIIIGVFVISALLEYARKWLLRFIPAEEFINKIIYKFFPKNLI